ncbi:MAG TPA: hypothetical protein ENN21_08320 [Spirochaetes bacterium]|nr:hypothetical protein [Spirochaetota bacterium]
MTQRKQYLLDRKFQLRTTFSMVGSMLAAAVIIVAVIGTIMTVNNRRLRNVMIINENIVNSLMTFSQRGTDPGEAAAVKTVSRLHEQNVRNIQRIIRHNTWMLYGIIGIFIVTGAGIFFVLIRKTHHISGPVYVMSNYIKDILAGKEPHTRQLRKNDELKEFHSLLCRLIEQTRSEKGE